MSKNYYSPGEWNIICDSCGRKIKSSHARHRWDGFIVCDSCFEYRHPQDLIRTKPDKQTVPFSRPRSTDTFTTTMCTIVTRSGVAEWGTADCAQVGREFDYFKVCSPKGGSGESDSAEADCARANITMMGN